MVVRGSCVDGLKGVSMRASFQTRIWYSSSVCLILHLHSKGILTWHGSRKVMKGRVFDAWLGACGTLGLNRWLGHDVDVGLHSGYYVNL